MKANEIRELPDDEIRTEVDKRRRDIFQMRLRAGSEDVQSGGSLRSMKRDIARLLTILRERELKKAENNG